MCDLCGDAENHDKIRALSSDAYILDLSDNLGCCSYQTGDQAVPDVLYLSSALVSTTVVVVSN